jgi:ankyrin repeat protein
MYVGLTPLHLASLGNHSNVVDILMQNGALIYRSYTGNNPYYLNY